MIADPQTTTSEVLDFWFGHLSDEGLPTPEISGRWYKKSDEFDQEIRERFAWFHGWVSQSASRTNRPDWLHSKEQLLSCVIVLDQFPRNMFRNTPAMFSSDALAQMLTLELVGLGYDKTMPVAQASFCYMPLMHSEQTPDQQRCVELFIELSQRTSGSVRETVEFQLGYAKAHRDIVARFGRFPHRNQVLGRQSTEEELAFLKEPGSSF